MRKRLFFVLAFAAMVPAMGCRSSESRYRAVVQRELASGRKENVLLFDIRFGMSRKEFYNYCWLMHQKDSFEDGGNVTSVMYRMGTQLKHPASLKFFPEFRQDSIYKLWAQVSYDAWAPWNRQLWADSLLPDVVRLYNQWYPGNEFIRMTDEKRGTIYIKVDGNRRIIIGRKDDSRVNIDYTNLLVENNIKD
jgi:hypothetical protein